MNNNQKNQERRQRRRFERANQAAASSTSPQTAPIMSEQNRTEDHRQHGYPMPKLQKLLALTKVPSNWTSLELYMFINGKKITKHFPEYQKMDTNGPYRNGVYLEKTEHSIHFTSYTPIDGICAYNHHSIHSKTYGLLSGKVNLFGSEDMFQYYGDGSDYVNEYLDALINRAQEAIKNGLPFWDVILQSADPISSSYPIENVPDKKPTVDELEYEKRRKEMYMPDLLALLTKHGHTYEFVHK